MEIVAVEGNCLSGGPSVDKPAAKDFSVHFSLRQFMGEKKQLFHQSFPNTHHA
jgi:hypothetical protein